MIEQIVGQRCRLAFCVACAAGVFAFAVFGCTKTDQDKPPTHRVRIAAAADLQFALEEVIADFKRRQPDIDVAATYGASGNFYAQLSNHAPFDLFLSADMDYPNKLVEQDLGIKETAFSYAVGHLVLWVPNRSSLNVEKLGTGALLDPEVKKIAIANPKHAPYGKAAEAALKKLDLYGKIEDKLVFGDNVAQAAQFVESGAASAGLIPLSLAKAPAMRDKGRYIDVPPESYPRLDQGGVVLAWAQDKKSAREFCDFLRSGEGKAILKRFGFDVPNE
jgi:molybdate transport system substrate-binding protein